MSTSTPNSGSGSSRRIREAAAAWVARRDAGMDAVQQAEFERWLAADPRHEAALAFFDSAWSALAAPARAGAVSELELELAALARRRRRRRTAAVTSFALVLLAAGAAWWPMRSTPSTVQAVPVAVVVHPRVMALADGSTIELNAGAEVSVEYTNGVRHVTLHRGEAHFSVHKDQNRPFIVSANGIDVRAVGTAFDVEIASKSVAVLVTEGRVSVESAAMDPAAGVDARTAAPKPTLAVLSAGDQAVIEGEAHAPRVEISSINAVARRLAWREPHVEFTRAPLSEAIALLNENAAGASPRLVIGDRALAQVRVTGVFRANNIDGFVALLERGFSVEAERTENTIILRTAR